MQTYLKPSNIKEIDKFLKDRFNTKIVENKLFALLKLVNDKGQKATASHDEKINGLKVLEYKKGVYIGFIKKVYSNGSMQLKTITLKDI